MAQRIGLRNVGYILLSLAMIGMGIVPLLRPPRTIGSVVVDVVTICFGALFLLAGLLASSPAQAARETDERYRKLYGGLHERRPTDEGEIAAAGLDRAFYGTATDEFEAAGFRRLPDFVDVTIANSGLGTRTVIRPFISSDGRMLGAAYDMRFGLKVRVLQWLGGKSRDYRTLELQTELDDETFCSTSTAVTAARTSEFTGLSRRHLPRGSALRELLHAHLRHLADLLKQKPGVAPVVIASEAEAFSSSDRLQLLKNRHRNSAAFNPLDEIQRIAGKPLTEQQRAFAVQAAELHAKRVGVPIAGEASPPPAA